MPGRANESPPLQLVAAAIALVAVVGYVVFGWRFGGESNTLSTALAVVAVAIAIGATAYRRLS
jgi:membrane protein YdbS with pleckstrin-like domain